MKKKLLSYLILSIATIVIAQAQTKEKGVFVETSASFSSTHNKNSAIITPAIGYQFNERWSAGMKIGFETGDYPWQIYTPFVRLKVLDISKLSLFTEAQFNIWDRNVDGGQSGYGELGLSFGLTYPLSQHLNFIGHYLFMGYSDKDNKDGAWLGNGELAIDGNIQRAQLGIQFIF